MTLSHVRELSAYTHPVYAAVGKLVEKIERFIGRKEDEEHESTQKTTAVRNLARLGDCFCF